MKLILRINSHLLDNYSFALHDALYDVSDQERLVVYGVNCSLMDTLMDTSVCLSV